MKNDFIGKRIPVNNQGWIMLCDVMGNDIAEAARTSSSSTSQWIPGDKFVAILRGVGK